MIIFHVIIRSGTPLSHRGDQIFFSATCPGQVASKNPLVLKDVLLVPKYFTNRKSIGQIANTTISYLKCNSNQYMRRAVTYNFQATFLIYNRTHNLINFCQIFQQTHFHEMKCRITVIAGADKSKKIHFPTGKSKKKITCLAEKPLAHIKSIKK